MLTEVCCNAGLTGKHRWLSICKLRALIRVHRQASGRDYAAPLQLNGNR
jgi:hypothetical protein